MMTYRSDLTTNGAAGSADQAFAAMQRHHDRAKGVTAPAEARSSALPPPSPLTGIPGDVIYGARAIALYLFGENDNRARRRVFNLWMHYRDRKEPAGFFKLKGALCLSKSKWREFHGL